MIKIKLFCVIFFCAISFNVIAQKAIFYTNNVNSPYIENQIESNSRVEERLQNNNYKKSSFSVMDSCDTRGFFNHLDVALSLGSTGLGFDVIAPIGKYLRLRAGFSFMPRFEMSSNFRVQVGDSLDKKWDKQGNRLETKFDKLSGYLKSFVGYEVDDEVEMLCKPTYYNFKLLVDIHPFLNQHWYLTAGIFIGPSEIAQAYNTTEEMPSLLSVSMWNMMYDKAVNWEPIYGDFFMPPALEQKLMQYGRMGFHAGNYTHDGIDAKGNSYKKGDKYMMVPDEKSGMVKATIKANRFKPYLGLGYGGPISKDGLTQLSFDAGAMFWGGTPSMITHDGTDLTHDVENVRGKLGRYVKATKFFKAFPLLEVRISRRIF